MDQLTPILTGLVPSLGLLAVFVFSMRAIVRADRNERAAQEQLDRESTPTAP